MIVDTSALFSILYREDGFPAFLNAMAGSGDSLSISAGTLVEAYIVAQRSGVSGMEQMLSDLIADNRITTTDVTPEQARLAIEAHRTFGKGSGHRARLNFGDCFSYALAKANDEPLLFKGDDFAQTDIRSVLAQG